MHHRRRLRLALCSHLLSSIALSGGPLQPRPVLAAPVHVHHMDFEADSAGALPAGCRSGRSLSAGYRIVASPQAAHSGGLGFELSLDRWLGSGIQTGYATFRISADSLRGQRIRVSAWGRFEQFEGINDGEGLIWLQVRRNSAAPTAIRDSGTPITRPVWAHVTASMNVPADADSLSFGALMTGRGRFMLDDLVVESTGPAGEGDAPPRPLTKHGVSNLRALGAVAALAQFFHPGDAAANTDWLQFLIRAVGEIESAPDQKTLASRNAGKLAKYANDITVSSRSYSS